MTFEDMIFEYNFDHVCFNTSYSTSFSFLLIKRSLKLIINLIS